MRPSMLLDTKNSVNGFVLFRCCCLSTKEQAACTPSKLWRRETLLQEMKWKGNLIFFTRPHSLTSRLSYKTKPKVTVVVTSILHLSPALSPVWCVRSGSLRLSTAPATPFWSICLHVSRHQNMFALSWNTLLEETSWCIYILTSFLSHVLCELCSVSPNKICMCFLRKLHPLCVCGFINVWKVSAVCNTLYAIYPTGFTQHVWCWACSSFMTIRLCIGESLHLLSTFF